MPSRRAMHATSLISTVRLRPFGWLILAKMMPKKTDSMSTALVHCTATSHATAQQTPIACVP